jgi:hypothetical protein
MTVPDRDSLMMLAAAAGMILMIILGIAAGLGHNGGASDSAGTLDLITRPPSRS